MGTPSQGRFSPGISTSLKLTGLVFNNRTDSPTDTFPRVTTAPLRGSPRDYHKRALGAGPSLGFPVPGCLARSHPQLVLAAGLAARRLLLTPLMLGSGSSFPADSAKPVPLAVVSLDSR